MPNNKEGWVDWLEKVAIAKAKVINQLGLDIYFEDIPVIVVRLRELCPKTKIIQYGGRI